MISKTKKSILLSLIVVFVLSLISLSAVLGVRAEDVAVDKFVGTEDQAGVLFSVSGESKPNQLLHPTEVKNVELTATDYIAVRYKIIKHSPDKSGFVFKLHVNALNNFIYKGETLSYYFYSVKKEIGSVTANSEGYLPRKAAGFNGYLIFPCSCLKETISVTDVYIHLEDAVYQETVWYDVSRIRLSNGIDLYDTLENSDSFETAFDNENISVERFVDFSTVSKDNINQKATVVGGWGQPIVAKISAYGSSRATFVEKESGKEGNIALQKTGDGVIGNYVAVKLALINGQTDIGIKLDGVALNNGVAVSNGGVYASNTNLTDLFRGYVIYPCHAGKTTYNGFNITFGGVNSAKVVLYGAYTFTTDSSIEETASSIADNSLNIKCVEDLTGIKAEELNSRVTATDVSCESKTIKESKGLVLSGNSNESIKITVDGETEKITSSLKIVLSDQELIDCANYDGLSVKVIGTTGVFLFSLEFVDFDGDVFGLSDKTNKINFVSDEKKVGTLNVVGGKIALNNNIPGTINICFNDLVCSNKTANGILNKIKRINFNVDCQSSKESGMSIVNFALFDALNEGAKGLTDTRTYTKSYDGTADINLYDYSLGQKVTLDEGLNLTVNNLLTACGLSYDEKAAEITNNIVNDSIVYEISLNEGYKLNEITFSGEGTITVDGLSFVLKNVSKEGVVSVTFTPVEYNIYYNLNGGTNSANNPVKYNVTTSRITLISPKKDGCVFKGWYDNADFNGEAIASIAKGTTGDVTLYAKWEVKEGEAKAGTWQTGLYVVIGVVVVGVVATVVLLTLKKKKKVSRNNF